MGAQERMPGGGLITGVVPMELQLLALLLRAERLEQLGVVQAAPLLQVVAVAAAVVVALSCLLTMQAAPGLSR